MKRGWEVEWTVSVPYNKDSESYDHDLADTRFKDFASKDSAMKFANETLPKDWYGRVKVREFYMEPYGDGYPGESKEYGEAIYVGDE